MSTVVLNGDTSGQIALTVPAVSGSNTITLPATTDTAAVLGNLLGVNQTWQNLTGSRAYGTTYTNTTGKPISVFSITNGVSSTLSASVSGVTAANSNTTGSASVVFFIVPPSATYVVTAGGGATLVTWSELR